MKHHKNTQAQSHSRPYVALPYALLCSLSVAHTQNTTPNTISNTLSTDTIVVTAAGFSQDVKDAPASISVLSKEDITQQPFQNIGGVLNALEGISVEQGSKSGGANIGIRGLPSDYTLLLIDGKRLSQNSSGARPNGFGDVDSNFIPPASAIERIEVVRGPMSTLYGSDALGGVVNIITKKVPDHWGGEINVYHTQALNNDFGSHSGISFYAAGPLKKDYLSLALSGNLQKSTDAKGSYYANQSDRDNHIQSGKIANFSGLGEKKLGSLGAKLVLTPNANHDVTLSYDFSDQRYDNSDEQLGTLNTSVPINTAGGGYTDEMKFTRERVSLSHNGRYDFGRSETSILWDSTKTLGRLNPVSIPNKVTDSTPRDIKFSNVILDHKWMFGLGNHFLSVGGQYKQQSLNDTLAMAPIKVKQWQWALFAEDEWQITDALSATFGGRFDQNEQFGSHFSPRVYLSWKINDQWQLKGGIGRAFKAPDVNLMTDDIIGFGGQGTIPLLGNAKLKPETATSSELSLLFDNQTNFSSTITGFYTSFNDKIDSETVANCRASKNPVAGCLDIGDWQRRGKPVAEFSRRVNVEGAKLYGVELSAKYQITDGLSLKSNYTYTKSERLDGTRKLPLNSTALHAFNSQLAWQVDQQWDIWVKGAYRAKQFNALNWNQEKVYYKNYGTVDLGVNYKVKKDISLSAGIYNVFDRNFVDYQAARVGTSAPTASSDYENRNKNIIEGRRLWASLKYTF